MKNKGIIFILLSALIYGITPFLCAITYRMGNNPFSMTFFRSFLIIPILFVIIKKKKIDLKLKREEIPILLLAGSVGACLTTLLLYESYQYITIATATTLHFNYPVFVLLISILYYKIPVKVSYLVVIVIAMIGIGCFINLNDAFHLKGILYALCSGIAYAFFMILLDKHHLSHMDNYKLSFYLAVIISVVLLLCHFLWQQIIFYQSVHNYVYMFLISISTSLFGIIFFKEGIRLIGAEQAAIFSLFEPLSSIILGVVFFQMPISLIQMLGCSLIFCSVLLLIKLEYQKN